MKANFEDAKAKLIRLNDADVIVTSTDIIGTMSRALAMANWTNNAIIPTV